MADIFISYAREDRDCAERLARELASRGWSVWWDRQIQVGKSFSRMIEKELDAARCVVVLWSRHSIESEWVVNEAAEGLRRGILIPVAIEQPIRPPLEFRRLQTANLAGWPGVGTEIDACFEAISHLVRPLERPGTDPPAEPAPASILAGPAAAVRPRWRSWALLAAALLAVLAIVIFVPRKKEVMVPSDAAALMTGGVSDVPTATSTIAPPASGTVAERHDRPPSATPPQPAPEREAARPRQAHLTYDEYITAGGENFVAIQLFTPTAAGINTAQDARFIGHFATAKGRPLVFDVPARLLRAGQGVSCEVSLTIPPGSYRARMALVQQGAEIIQSLADLTIRGLKADEPGVSKMLLARDVFPLDQAQQPKDPFAFGGVKVTPRGDRVFVQRDELWYFLELRRPTASTPPDISIQIDVEGETAAGKKVRMSAPWKTAEVIAVKDVPGHFAIGSSIPLSTFQPGDYRIKVALREGTSGPLIIRDEPFSVIR